MTTLAEIENAVLGLSQVEFHRLIEWLTPLTQNRLRIMEPQTVYVEVLSPSTVGVDRHEKRIAYRRIAALEEYVIVAQDAVEVTVFRREDAWEPVVLGSLESVLELRSIGLGVSLAQIYEDEAPPRRAA
jgi:Uma2 family endonuclease